MVNRRRFLGLGATAMVLAGCVTEVGPAGVAPATSRSYDVRDLHVTVPRTLIVSEENAYYPSADIVWRGEPQGDRYLQVQRIFEEGMGRGVQALNGSQPVKVRIEVRRFHALTEKARYTVGGIHSIRFVLTVVDAATGEIVEGPRLISADLDALGGEAALAAERAGRGERVQVTAHLSRVIQRELGAVPAGG